MSFAIAQFALPFSFSDLQQLDVLNGAIGRLLLACALGVWAMLFLAVTIGMASRILGARLGTLFRI